MSTFTGFSEEDLKRIKSADAVAGNDSAVLAIDKPQFTDIKKIDKIGGKTTNYKPKYKLPQLNSPDEAVDNISFEKCRLSLKSPTSDDPNIINNNNCSEKDNNDSNSIDTESVNLDDDRSIKDDESVDERRDSDDITPDNVNIEADYTEDGLDKPKVNLDELQLKQRLMEEQNKKRKEMLARAIADRTKQTAEEVQKLEKIKKELQVLDGQFSKDVAVLRKKIDQSCLNYAEAEKHYLRVEKEFLQAKINLQKEKEKKELLTEHLCALITHNETRKAQKLEHLMQQLVDDKKIDNYVNSSDDEEPVIIDGVDMRTGKIVEFDS